MMPKLMSRPKRFPLALFAIALLNVSILGCAQSVYFTQQKKGYSKGDDCLFCHSPNGVKGVRDFSWIYNNPKSHHPVGVMYPLGSLSRPDFKQPNGYSGGTIFFDDDGYGELDNDDVRLFGTGNAVTVECASCHREHDDSAASGKLAAEHYLRFANEGSRLCITCHRQ